jgi:hypothetical protein
VIARRRPRARTQRGRLLLAPGRVHDHGRHAGGAVGGGQGGEGARLLHCNTSHLSPGLTSPVSPTTRRGGGDPRPALHRCARQGVGSCTQESVQESGRTGISSNTMASPASTTTGVTAKMTTTTSTSHRKTLAAAWTCRGYPPEITAADYGRDERGGDDQTSRRIERSHSGWPSTVQEERGVLPRSSESRLRRLLPDRDVASTLGCERFAMPSAPPLPQRHPCDLRHEVELAWPHVAVR